MAAAEIICCECNKGFPFSSGEREYYREKGFVDPKRCPDCRKRRREQKSGKAKASKE